MEIVVPYIDEPVGYPVSSPIISNADSNSSSSPSTTESNSTGKGYIVIPTNKSEQQISEVTSIIQANPMYIGKVRTFCYLNNNPLFTIGPHCMIILFELYC